MLKIDAAHHLEYCAERLLAFILQIIETICGRFIKVNLSVENPLEKLVQGGFTVAIFSVNNSHSSVRRAFDFAMLFEVPEIFKLDFTYFHF